MDNSEGSPSFETKNIGYHEIGDRVVRNLLGIYHWQTSDNITTHPTYHNRLSNANQQLATLAMKGIPPEEAFKTLFSADPTMNTEGRDDNVYNRLLTLTVFVFDDHPFLRQFPQEFVIGQFAGLLTRTIANYEKALVEEKGTNPVREYVLKSNVTDFKQILSEIRGESGEKVEDSTKPAPVAETKEFKKRISSFFRRK